MLCKVSFVFWRFTLVPFRLEGSLPIEGGGGEGLLLLLTHSKILEHNLAHLTFVAV